MDLDLVSADYPIHNVITFVYGHYPCSSYKFPNKSGSYKSKGLPDIKQQ